MIEKQEYANTAHLNRKIRESPEEYFKCYPNLSWALAHRIVLPNGTEASLEENTNAERQTVDHRAINRFLRETFIPEYQIAEVIEGLNNGGLSKINGSRLLESFAAGLGLLGLRDAFRAIPIHDLAPNALIHVLWLTGCTDKTAFVQLLSRSIDLRMFERYPILSLAVRLSRFYGIDKALANVLTHNDHTGNLFRHADLGGTVPDLGGAEFYGILVAIVSDFYRFAGMPMETLEISDQMSILLADQSASIQMQLYMNMYL